MKVFVQYCINLESSLQHFGVGLLCFVSGNTVDGIGRGGDVDAGTATKRGE